MPYFKLEAPGEIRLVKITDIDEQTINAHMEGFRVAAGRVETWTKDDKMPATFTNRLLKHGYTPITETQYQEYLDTAADLLLPKTKDPQHKAYTMVPWKTIEAQFAPPFLNDVEEYLEDPVFRNFCLYPGDTVIDGDLVIDFSELGSTPQTATRNIIVNGDLTIKGNFDAGRNITALPQFVYITGNLYANNLLLSGWLDMIVAGDVTLTGTVLGYFGEPGGRLLVKGDLKTGHLLNGFMYRIKVEGSVTGACYSFDPEDSIDGFSVQKIKSSFTSENELSAYPLTTDVIPYDKDVKEYSFIFETAGALLRKGQSIFV